MELAAFLFVCTLGCSFALGAERFSPLVVKAECQMVIVKQADALKLLPDLQDSSKSNEAVGRVAQLVRNGTATMVADLIAKGSLKTKLVSETGEDLRYATEFEPPKLPADVPAANAAEILKAWPHTGATPTAFEARHVGQTFTAEVIQDDESGLLLVNVVPQHVRFLRWNKIDAGRFANGERFSIEQPIFHTMMSEGNFPLRNGEWVLLSMHRVPDAEEPSFEFFLLHVVVEKITKGK